MDKLGRVMSRIDQGGLNGNTGTGSKTASFVYSNGLLRSERYDTMARINRVRSKLSSTLTYLIWF